jgi:hypothetical protein
MARGMLKLRDVLGRESVYAGNRIAKIGRRVAGTARRLRRNADESRRREIQLINKGVDEPHRISGLT